MLSNKEQRQKYDAIRQFGMGGRVSLAAPVRVGSTLPDSRISSVRCSAATAAMCASARPAAVSNLNDIFSMFGGAAGGRGGASYGGSRYGNPYEEPPTPQRGDDRKSRSR